MNEMLSNAKKIIYVIIFSISLEVCALLIYGYYNLVIFTGFVVFVFLAWIVSDSRVLIDYKVILQKLLVYSFPSFNRKNYMRSFYQFENIGRAKIYRRKNIAYKLAAFNEKVLVYIRNDKKAIRIENAQIGIFHYNIHINDFPGIIKDSAIEKVLVLPYVRRLSENALDDTYRIVVFTNKCQIFHNYPDREKHCAGTKRHSDLIKFDESVVWERDSGNQIEEEIRFDYFHPKLNSDPSFIDKYNNGGFSYTSISEVPYKRFKFCRRSRNSNPFMFMGGVEYNKKICLIGTYQSNTIAPVRTCVFASSDGGRQWYLKYEFGDLGIYEFQQGLGKEYGKNYGDDIDIQSLDIKGSRIKLRKRLFPHEYKCYMDAIEDYNWSDAVSFEIKSDSGTLHGYGAAVFSNGNIVRVYDDDKAIEGLFKVEVLSQEEIQLHLFESEHGNLPCRHIHSINIAKDGFYITTGEIYPNGWVLFFEQNLRDNGFLVNAASEFRIKVLNNSPNAAQRLMGIFDYDERYVLFGSDHDVLMNRDTSFVDMPFQRNSLGIYKGSISELNNFSKFECIKLLEEPVYFFKRINGIIICVGQSGHFLISFDNSMTWDERKLPSAVENCTGVAGDFILLGDYLVEIS